MIPSMQILNFVCYIRTLHLGDYVIMMAIASVPLLKNFCKDKSTHTFSQVWYKNH